MKDAIAECDRMTLQIKSDVNQLDEEIVQVQQDARALKEQYSKVHSPNRPSAALIGAFL